MYIFIFRGKVAIDGTRRSGKNGNHTRIVAVKSDFKAENHRRIVAINSDLKAKVAGKSPAPCPSARGKEG